MHDLASNLFGPTWLLAVDQTAADAPPSLVHILLGTDAAGSTWVSVLLIVVGMLLITKGGDYFTDAAVAIARATRIPSAIIGATIVSIATTFPEFMVSLTGTLSGKPAFAVGNALGSCCCNIGVIVGTCALLKGFLARRRGEEPGIPANRTTLLGPGLFMLTAGVVVWSFGIFDSGGAMESAGQPAVYGIARWQGIVLILILLGYLGYSLRTALKARFEAELTSEEEQDEEQIRENLGRQFLIFAVGAVLVVIGSRLLVANAAQIARVFGVPELIVGITILAIGTSLPEYTISLLAVIKGHGALGMGNIIGANVLNICWVVATCSLLAPLPIQRQTVVLDGPAVLLLMLLLLLLPAKRERISTAAGAILVTVYAIYLALMFSLFGAQ